MKRDLQVRFNLVPSPEDKDFVVMDTLVLPLVEECWYQPAEIRRLKAECKRTCELQRRGIKEKMCDDTFRGLEGKQPGMRGRRECRVFAAQQSVLTEQKRQEMTGSWDGDMIAVRYQPHSITAIEEAQRQGHRDEKDAREEKLCVAGIEFADDEEDNISVLSDDGLLELAGSLPKRQQNLFSPGRPGARRLISRVRSIIKQTRA